MTIKNSISDLNWYVLFTYPQYEKKVHGSLLQKEINSFLPTRTVLRQWSDRKKKVEVPLFPNYVFVQTHIHERFKILNFYGVSRFVEFNGKPAVMMDKEIQTIKKIISVSDLCVEEHYMCGDKVVIQDGIFSGLEGFINKKNGKTRFSVHISSIDHTLSVDLPAASLIKVL